MIKTLLTSKYSAFLGIALLSFGCYLDYTIVNIALPTIEHEFGASLTQLQWVMNVYFLALCVLATLMGRIGDIWGIRRCFYFGAVIFGIASVIAGFAITIEWLIVGRLLQGVGAALVFPLGLSLLPHAFPVNERARFIAYLGSLGGIALALGPVLGGIIVSHWGWRWIFLINIPILLIGFIFCINSVKEAINEHKKLFLDWKGAVTLSIALSGIVLGFVQGHTHFLEPMTLIYFAVGFIFSVVFFYIEKNQSDPLIDFNDFRKPLFYAGSALVFSAGVFSAVVLFFSPLYLDLIREFSAQKSGWILFSIPAAVFVVALFTDKIIIRIGVVNTILTAFFMSALSFSLQIFFTNHTSILYMIITFVFLGSMWAFGNTVPIIAAHSSVTPSRKAVATGTMVTLFNIGGALGLAVGVTIYSYYPSFMQGFIGVTMFLLMVSIFFLFNIDGGN